MHNFYSILVPQEPQNFASSFTVVPQPGQVVGAMGSGSGTTGAAIEGTLQGIKSYSFSLSGAKNGSDFWPTALRYIPEVVKKTAFEKWPALTFFNINFPECLPDDVKGVKVARLSSRKIGDAVDVMEQTAETCRFKIGYARKGVVEPDSDTQVVSEGFISVTPVRIDMTAYDALSNLPFNS